VGATRRGTKRRQAAVAGVVGALGAGNAHAVALPADDAEAMYHLYDGGGTTAQGPAFLVRKSMADKVSLSGEIFVDMVSNASIDVVTTASPYKETRNEFDAGLDYVVRDTLIHVSAATSHEPDYLANTFGADVTQDVFGGMTTVALGFTLGSDKVGEHGVPGYFDEARHWQYRLGLTQILTPRWVASANLEAIDDDGYLGSPYRVARVFGATVPERMPRTRESRALRLGIVGDITPKVEEGVAEPARSSVHAEYRYFWDTWDIRAHTLEAGYSRYFGQKWVADGFFRFYKQDHALFYSDDAQTVTTYITRNRQLSTFHDIGLGADATYTWKDVPGQYNVKFKGSYELMTFHYDDFTDVRTGKLYSFDAHVLELVMSATF
jgi:hypothetical protein